MQDKQRQVLKERQRVDAEARSLRSEQGGPLQYKLDSDGPEELVRGKSLWERKVVRVYEEHSARRARREQEDELEAMDILPPADSSSG